MISFNTSTFKLLYSKTLGIVQINVEMYPNKHMFRFTILNIFLLFTFSASADQLDGLEHLDTILILGLIASLGAIVLFISLFIATVNGLANKKHKTSIGINLSCTVLIICSLIALLTLGSSIDPGFLLVCLGVIGLSAGLIFLNMKLAEETNSQEE